MENFRISLSNLNSTLSAINENFVDGTSAGDDLACPDPCDAGVAPLGYRMASETQLTSYPNPSHETVIIEFSLPYAGETVIEIFSSLGNKLVFSQKQGLLAAGKHAVTWDGKGPNGNTVGTGLYLIQLRLGEDRKAIKVLRF